MVMKCNITYLERGTIQRDMCSTGGEKNSSTCHQCRQKTIKISAVCKNVHGKSRCTMKMCYKCLLNRYGEIAEEVSLLKDWKCPRCRGICNCSICMKKKGHKPTGQLAYVAKVHGFSSVSDMLQKTTYKPENPTKTTEDVVSLCAAIGNKESQHNPATKKLSKTKREEFKEISNSLGNDFHDGGCRKKARICRGNYGVGKINENDNIEVVSVKTKLHEKVATAATAILLNQKKFDSHTTGNDADKVNIQHVVHFPSGERIRVVAGVSVSPEDVGDALQFLEFCDAFGEALNIMKGQPEAILTEIVNGGKQIRLRSMSDSLVSQIHIRLLNMIWTRKLKEPPSKCIKSCWFQVLADIVSQCPLMASEFSTVDFKKGVQSYTNLEVSKKFKLLNFLCDGVLNTNGLRKWIIDKRKIFSERRLKKVQEVKGKQRQKIGDEIPNHRPGRNEKAHATILDMANAIRNTSKGNKTAKFVRTVPVLRLSDGRILWKLNCNHGLSDHLLQDIKLSSWDAQEQKWVTYNAEEREEVDKVINGSCPQRIVRSR